MEIHKNLGRLFIENLDFIDAAIFCPTRGIIGQSWRLNIELEGELDHQGFVCDFSEVKKIIKTLLKDSLDHSLIVPINARGVNFIEKKPETLEEHWEFTSLNRTSHVKQETEIWTYCCPQKAIYPIRSTHINEDVLEAELTRLVRHRLPEHVQNIVVQLKKEKSSDANIFFHYTHGITSHKGLCQRLFHGHRSRLQVYVNHERRIDLEYRLVHELLGESVHICSPQQIVGGTQLTPGCRGTAGETITIEYKGTTGNYRAQLPAHRVFLVEPETSIECIARWLCKTLEQWEPALKKEHLQVKVYEGINKGAMSTNAWRN